MREEVLYRCGSRECLIADAMGEGLRDKLCLACSAAMRPCGHHLPPDSTPTIWMVHFAGEPNFWWLRGVLIAEGYSQREDPTCRAHGNHDELMQGSVMYRSQHGDSKIIGRASLPSQAESSGPNTVALQTKRLSSEEGEALQPCKWKYVLSRGAARGRGTPQPAYLGR